MSARDAASRTVCDDARSAVAVVAPSTPSMQPRSSRAGAPLSPSAAAAALALTSKQRLLSDETLRTVAHLLRHTAAQLEAAALQEVMADPVASEYIMASAARGDDNNASAAATSTHSGDADRSALSLMSTSESAVDMVAGTWSHTFGHDVVAHSIGSPLSRHNMGSTSHVQVTAVPTAVQTAASPKGSRTRHGRAAPPPPSELRRRPRQSLNGTPVEQALRMAGAIASSSTYSYTFPTLWFCPPASAVVSHAVPPHSMRPTSQHRGTQPASVAAAAAASVKGFRPHWQAPRSSSSMTLATASSDTTSRSQSLGTAVFLPSPSPDGSPMATGARRASCANHGEPSQVLAAATAQPPLFFDNLLFDPATGRHLFGGHAFREEARILLAHLASAASPLAVQHAGDTDCGANGSKTSRTVPSPVLVLVREYIPVAAGCGAGGDGTRPYGGADAMVVQCFSLLPPQLTHLRPNRYQLLSEATIGMCLLVALPGCVTLATPLHAFLQDERHSLLSIAGSPLERLLGNAHDAVREAGERLGVAPRLSIAVATAPTSARARPSMSLQSMPAPLTPGGDAGAVSPVADAAARVALEAAERDRDAARIAVVGERLTQMVLPDVLDEALHALQSTLVVYCIEYEQRRHMHTAVNAVRVLQRFFRRYLAVKERAVRRMVRLWRRLEVDARLKLQQHRPLPTALERMDAVANSILQEHMLTSPAYKRGFIEDQWVLRRRAFAKWKEEEAWNDVFASSAAWRGGGDGAMDTGAHLQVRRPRSSRLSPAEQQRLEAEFDRRRRGSDEAPPPPQQQPQRSASGASSTVDAGPSAEREQAAIRRFLCWYMDPSELLYLSHQRLLETLKSSVFRMVEVQQELKRAAHETAVEEEGSSAPRDSNVSVRSTPRRR
ncbi:hypothetical protein NESM_000391200 [Novymonas esmeraldas]|uniref:Uncharacterized protein n=1 Tax=Novymonas esmeraldas TaxID=1808958 RepID=A0AAW0EM34_9TRYP